MILTIISLQVATLISSAYMQCLCQYMFSVIHLPSKYNLKNHISPVNFKTESTETEKILFIPLFQHSEKYIWAVLDHCFHHLNNVSQICWKWFSKKGLERILFSAIYYFKSQVKCMFNQNLHITIGSIKKTGILYTLVF